MNTAANSSAAAAACEKPNHQYAAGAQLEITMPAASSSPAASLAQTCYIDALHSVFKWLSLKELPSILCCRLWSDAAYKEKSRTNENSIIARSNEKLLRICHSPLSRHVSALCVDFPLDLSCLRMMALLPHLATLRLVLHPDTLLPFLQQHSMRRVFVEAFPTTLTRIELNTTPLSSDSHAERQLLLDGAASALGLKTLFWEYVEGYNVINLDPLTQLQQLSTLVLAPYGKGQLTRQQLQSLKQIPSLTKLDVNGGAWRLEDLRFFCSQLPQLQQLTEINIEATPFSGDVAAELSKLPLLSSLQFRIKTASAISSLPLFKNLTFITLELENYLPSVGEMESLRISLSACPALTGLSVRRHSWANVMGLLSSILSGVKLLRLELERVQLSSLSFLEHLPGLTALRLEYIEPRLSASALFELAPFLPQLSSLSLTNAIELSDMQHQQLQPHSAIFPALRSLEYNYAPPLIVMANRIYQC
jgi:hypothetical protein